MLNSEKLRIFQASEKSEGSGARVRRPFPGDKLNYVDPFVLLDEFFVDPSAGFPEHPHRGFEAITYMLEGGFKHEDSSGNSAVVETGGLQRITMGKGIKHSESPVGEGTAHGIQLWVNLSQSLKGIEPDYEIVPGEDLKVTEEEGVREKILVDKETGPTVKTPINYRDVQLEDSKYHWKIRDGSSGFVYVTSGSGQLEVDGESFKLSEADIAIKEGSDEVVFRLSTEAEMRFIALSGIPHGEPIDQHGPYVD